jgi:hypothetical protein
MSHFSLGDKPADEHRFVVLPGTAAHTTKNTKARHYNREEWLCQLPVEHRDVLSFSLRGGDQQLVQRPRPTFSLDLDLLLRSEQPIYPKVPNLLWAS